MKVCLLNSACFTGFNNGTKLAFNYQQREEKEPALIPRNIDDISHQLIKNVDGSLEKLSVNNINPEVKKEVTQETKRTVEEAMELF